MATNKGSDEERSLLVEMGKRLRAEREAVKITQREMAQALGLYPAAISRIEDGLQRLPAYLAPEWARQLGLRVERLYGEIPAAQSKAS